MFTMTDDFDNDDMNEFFEADELAEIEKARFLARLHQFDMASFVRESISQKLDSFRSAN